MSQGRPVSDVSDVFADGEARILDRGFRHYDGPRLRWGPVRTVVVQGIQRGLGIRRKFSAKILPFLGILAAYVPAIVFIGIASMFRGGQITQLVLPSYSDYFANISLAILLLTALVAPEVFGNDQKNGMLGIYLASPLTRNSYLWAKSASVLTILALITAGPQVLLLIASTVQGVGPATPVDWIVLLLRILASGLVVGSLLTAMSVTVTVLTNNKGIATASIVVLLIVLAGIAGSLAAASGYDEWNALSILTLVLALPAAVHGERLVDGLPSATFVWIGWALWVGLGAAISWYRVQHLEVTR
jgi:ABC-2 type transport system permease protein